MLIVPQILNLNKLRQEWNVNPHANTFSQIYTKTVFGSSEINVRD